MELLANFVSLVEDSFYNRMKNDANFNERVANKECFVFDDIDTAKSLRFNKQTIDGNINMDNNNVKSYQDVITNRKKINDGISAINKIKPEKVAKYLDIKGALETMNEKLEELNQIIENNNTAFLPDARTHKASEITRARDAIIEGGVEFKGHIFQSAKADRDLLTSTISLFSIAGKVPDGFTWIAKDNTPIPMTLQELIQLGTLMANNVSEHTYKARALKDSLQTINSVKEIESVKYEA